MLFSRFRFHFILLLGLTLSTLSLQSQDLSSYDTYQSSGNQPAIYDALEKLQQQDLAIIGIPSFVNLEFVCLTPISASATIDIEMYSYKTAAGGSWTAGEVNRVTLSAALKRGDIVRLTGGDPGTATIVGSGTTVGAYAGIKNSNPTDPVHSWSPLADELLIVKIDGTVVDYVLNTDITTADQGIIPTLNGLPITGGMAVSGSSIVTPGSGPNPDTHSDYHFSNFSNITNAFGLGFPGFLEARRDATRWFNGTRAVDWDATASAWMPVCPTAEFLLFAGTQTVDDSFLAAVDTAQEIIFDAYFQNVPVGFSGVLNPSVDFAAPLSLSASSRKRFGGSMVRNSGGVSWPNGKVFLEGAASQTLEGFTDLDSIAVGASGATIKSLNGSSSIALNPGGRLTATGAVTIAETDTLVLKSNANGTAAIGTQSASITGNLKVERYIEPITGEGIGGSGAGWVQIGNLIPGLTALDLTTQVGGATLYEWNPTVGLYFPLQDDTPLASPLASPPSYKGYFLQVPASESGYLLEFESASAVTVLADPVDGISIPLNTDGLGWNMLVNPFASPISVSSLFSENLGLQSIYVYSGRSNLYRNVLSGGGDFTTIDVGQAFWVPSRNVVGEVVLSTLTVLPTAKSPNNAPFIREADPHHLGTVGLVVCEASNPLDSATTYVSFRDDAEYGLDGQDIAYAQSMSASRFEVWSLDATGNSDVPLLSQSAGDLAHSSGIPLVIEAKQGGVVHFKLKETDLMPESVCAFLFDTVTGESWRLSNEIPVAIDLEGNTVYTGRFLLNFAATPEISVTSGFCSGGVVTLDEVVSGAPQSLELFELSTGELISAQSDGLNSLSQGVYELVVNMGDGCVNSEIFEVEGVCMGEMNGNDSRDVLDLMGILSFIGLEYDSYMSVDAKGADCDCDQVLTNMDIVTFLSVFGLDCE